VTISMDPELKKWAVTPVDWEPYESGDARGKINYGSAQTLTCYLAADRKMVRDVNGKEVVSNDTLYFVDVDVDILSITPKDRLTLPDGRQPPIIAIQTYYGEEGNEELVEVNL
jgi:hypothetical protein